MNGKGLMIVMYTIAAILMFAILALGIICVFWTIYVHIKYGGLPITEIPIWALKFLGH